MPSPRAPGRPVASRGGVAVPRPEHASETGESVESVDVEWEWSEHFAGQPEIERYMNHVVDRFDLRRHIRFDATVTSAVWDERHARWTVTTDDGVQVDAQHFVPATGTLSVPYLPAIEGRDSFAGPAYHTGRWPSTPVNCAGRRVALVGTGSSGVQIVPAISVTRSTPRSPPSCTCRAPVPRRYLSNSAGRLKMFEVMETAMRDGWQSEHMTGPEDRIRAHA